MPPSFFPRFDSLRFRWSKERPVGLDVLFHPLPAGAGAGVPAPGAGPSIADTINAVTVLGGPLAVGAAGGGSGPSTTTSSGGGGNSGTTSKGSGSVVIDVFNPFSGVDAALGTTYTLPGVKAAVAEINANGGGVGKQPDLKTTNTPRGSG